MHLVDCRLALVDGNRAIREATSGYSQIARPVVAFAVTALAPLRRQCSFDKNAQPGAAWADLGVAVQGVNVAGDLRIRDLSGYIDDVVEIKSKYTVGIQYDADPIVVAGSIRGSDVIETRPGCRICRTRLRTVALIGRLRPFALDELMAPEYPPWPALQFLRNVVPNRLGWTCRSWRSTVARLEKYNARAHDATSTRQRSRQASRSARL